MRVEHILIIRFSPLSDVVMTTPVVHALGTQYPHIRVTMLSSEEARPLFEHMPPNVGFMAADLKHEYYGVKGLNALYRRLTAKNFTAIADFHSVLRSDYLRMRFNVDRFKVQHVDKHRSIRRQLTSRNNKVMVPMPVVYESYADVLARLGYPVRLDLEPSSLFEGINSKPLPPGIGTGKQSGEQWIGIAPFGGYEGTTYPTEMMQQVIDKLLKRHKGARIFLFAGNDTDTARLDEWCLRYPACTNVARLTGGLSDWLKLSSRLDLMITMDNLFMHLAAVVAVPVVCVWGATHPYGGHTGWRLTADNYVQTDLACRPCSIHGRKNCQVGGYPCMRNIKPEKIVEKAEQKLG